MTTHDIFTLNNGLRVCLKPNKGMHSIAIQLRGFAGSNNESLNEVGAAHFLEHWILKGTQNYSSECDITGLVTNNGGKFIGITSRNDVLLGIHILKEYLNEGLLFMSEIFYKPLLTNETFKEVRKSAEPEITRTYDNPEKLIARLAYATIFPNQRPAKFNLGNITDLNKLSATKVRKFYKVHYRNDNFVLCITGNFSRRNIKNNIQKHFNVKTRKLNSNIKPKLKIPKTERNHINAEYKFKQEYLRIDYEGFKFTDKRKFAAIVLAKCLSTYIKNEGTKRGMTYKTNVESFSARDYGIFSFFGTCGTQHVNALQQIFIQSFKSYQSILTQQLFDSSKKAVIANLLFSLEKPSMQASLYTELLLHNDTETSIERIIERFNKVTLESCIQIAKILAKRTKKVTHLKAATS